MAIKYIPTYNAETRRREIWEYDTKHGFDAYQGHYGTEYFIWHRSLIVCNAFDTVEEAVKSFGEWSEVYIVLPDGREVQPATFLHPGYAPSPFIMWHPGVVELWPGEPGYGGVV